MREELVALARLAKIDDSARHLDIELQELPARIEGMRADVEALERLLGAEREQMDEAASLKADRAADMQLRIDALSRAKAKAAKASNLRESDAAEREVEANRRAIKEREEEIARLDEAIGSKRASLEERETQFQEARALLESEQRAAELRLEELRKERDAVTRGREDFVVKISSAVMRRYTRLHGVRGRAVSVVSDGICRQCRFALPPQLFIETQRAETLISCPNCQTMVVHSRLIEDESGED